MCRRFARTNPDPRPFLNQDEALPGLVTRKGSDPSSRRFEHRMQFWKGKSNEEGTEVSKRRKDVRGKEKPRHLYLVLDDWSWGYSIRKIDLSFGDFDLSFVGDPGQQLIPVGDERRGAICAGTHRLPSALFRFPGRRGEPKSILGAFDDMILAMPPLGRAHGLGRHEGIVIDINAQTFINGPPFNGRWKDAWADGVNSICIPVGGMLFFLGGSRSSFRVLYPACVYAYYYFVWMWSELPKPIFQCELVTSYAVHPDERTIFVSGSFGVPATFSISIVDPAFTSSFRTWKQHGPWQLPFTGRGYFDPELDAWVGLSAQLDTIGHICSCDVVSTNSDTSHQQCPALKVSKEKLFAEVPAERHMGATLVYMGSGSKFCLLEGIYIQADLADQPTESDEMNEDFVDELNETDSDEMNEYSVDEVNEEQDQKRFLRLTTFSLKYDKSGDLTTGNSCRVWYYSVPQQVTDSVLEYPVAFWM